MRADAQIAVVNVVGVTQAAQRAAAGIAVQALDAFIPTQILRRVVEAVADLWHNFDDQPIVHGRVLENFRPGQFVSLGHQALVGWVDDELGSDDGDGSPSPLRENQALQQLHIPAFCRALAETYVDGTNVEPDEKLQIRVDPQPRPPRLVQVAQLLQKLFLHQKRMFVLVQPTRFRSADLHP